MDVHFALQTSRACPGTECVAPGPQPLDTHGASLSLDLSWLAAKDEPVFRAGDISPIDCESDETGSETNAKNSFHSVARDASFIHLFTTVLSALNQSTACEVRRTPRLFGADFQCEKLTAKRRLGWSTVYVIRQDTVEVGTVTETGRGTYSVRTSAGTAAQVAYYAVVHGGRTERKAEVTCSSPVRRLVGKRCTGKECALQEDGCERLVLRKTTKGKYAMRFSQVSDVLAFGLAVSSLIQHNN